MASQNPQNRTGHARRRPEAVSRNAGTVPSRTTASSGQRTSAQPAAGSDYTFRAGAVRERSSAPTSVRRVPESRSVSRQPKGKVKSREEKRLVSKREKQQNAAIAEANWQNEVVRVKGGVDIFLLAIILILVALGTITVYSSSYPLAIAEGRESNYYLLKQLGFAGAGCVLMLIISFIPTEFYKKWLPFVAYGISLVLLVYTFIAGNAEGEARRWVRIGPVNVQPSELMKVSMVLLIAWYAEWFEKRMKVNRLNLKNYWYNTFAPCLIVGCGGLFVMIGKHLSGTLIIGMIGFLTLTVAGCRFLWLSCSAIPVGIVGSILFLLKNDYAMKRVTSFRNENADKLSDIYQTTQSIYAIGSGGLFGVGLGQSRQKYSYLTQAHTDFIFSIWCEEWGFIGAVVLILLYLLLIWRGYSIAARARDKFSMVTAFGITTHVGIQAILNMCVASDLIMNTGITLPFFSYGGSSLIVMLMEMGVLLSISRHTYRKKKDMEREKLLKLAGLD